MNDNKKIAFNSVVIFVRILVTSVIGLIASRLVLQALGASDYGLYNVVGGIVTMLNIIGASMSSSTYRYLAYELGLGDNGKPNKVFNTSLAIHAGFALLVVILGLTVGLWYINNYLNVDPTRLDDAKFVFYLSIATAVVASIANPFNGLLVAYEKFSVSAIIDIAVQSVKLLGIFLLIKYGGDKLRMYSVIMFSINLLNFLAVFIYSELKHHNVIKFNIYKDRNLYKEMLGFSGWILYGAAAGVGKTQGMAMLINYFFGTIINAAYAIAVQIENYILMFARSLNNAAIPQITKNFSGGNQNRSVSLASLISKYTYFLMLFVAFPMLLETEFILEIWLKDVPEGAALFTRLLILGGLLGCLGEGIPPLVQAAGKVKNFTLVTSTIQLLGLPIGWLLYKNGFNAESLLVVYLVIFGINAVVRLILLKQVMNFNVKEFVRTSYLKMVYVSMPLIIIYFFYDPKNFSLGEHIFSIAIMEIVLVIVILLLGLEKIEKQRIYSAIKNSIRRK